MEQKKETVLLVHNYYQIPGGEDTVVENEKNLLEKNGHRVILYTRSNKELESFPRWKKVFLPLIVFFNVRTYREIRRIIQKENVDVVHVHNTLHLISPAVYYAARSKRVPVVQTLHNFRLLCPSGVLYRDAHICENCIHKGLGQAVKNGCYRGSKLQTAVCTFSMKLHRILGIYRKISYIALSEFNKEKTLMLRGVKAEQIFVKPNFTDAAEKLRVDTLKGEYYIFVGRLDKLKGIELLFEAWKSMGDKAPKLFVCGIGPMEDWCKNYIKQNGLNQIVMKGFVPKEDVKKYMANSKALIFPTQWYEGFGMTVVEAYSVGTPVLVSDLGNAGSLVKEDVTGYKFRHDSVDALVKAVTKAEENPIRVPAEECLPYTEECNYQILETIYSRVLKRGENR